MAKAICYYNYRENQKKKRNQQRDIFFFFAFFFCSFFVKAIIFLHIKFTYIPKSCCFLEPIPHMPSKCFQALLVASTEHSQLVFLEEPVIKKKIWKFKNTISIVCDAYGTILDWKLMLRYAYKRGFCEVAEDGGDGVERVELALFQTRWSHVNDGETKLGRDNV